MKSWKFWYAPFFGAGFFLGLVIGGSLGYCKADPSPVSAQPSAILEAPPPPSLPEICIATIVPVDPWESMLDALIPALVVQEGAPSSDYSWYDNGNYSTGVLQIGPLYWIDGCRFLKVNWPYEMVKDPERSKTVARAYLKGYGKWWVQRSPVWFGKEMELMARLHNGGPDAPSLAKLRFTNGYWSKVQSILLGSR